MGGGEGRRAVIERLIQDVRRGRTVVPLLGAGVSVDAGVPSLSELTAYLAKTKAYIRHEIFRAQPPAADASPIFDGAEDGKKDGPEKAFSLAPFRRQPRDFLREFGWPDLHELNSDLWNWLARVAAPGVGVADRLGLLVAEEILDTLARTDDRLVDKTFRTLLRAVSPRLKPDATSAGSGADDSEWLPRSGYWNTLLPQLTRSSPDLVDSLFRRLAHRRQPALAHRYLAFLAPVLRIRLFLTINFDTLLEDALRVEGLTPNVFEVPSGFGLPHPSLLEEDLCVLKLHGGAYGLLVGERLDTPLDEETRARFRAYIPEHSILLVMGVGGWDERVLDMVEIARARKGDVLWLHFEPDLPPPIAARLQVQPPARDRGGDLIAADLRWPIAQQVRDPAAFLREVYTEFKGAHPASSRSFATIGVRPVPDPPTVALPAREDEAGRVFFSTSGRIALFYDHAEDIGLGAAVALAQFAARQSETHRVVWIDLERKANVEDVLVDIMQQLRRYDPSLPPELLVIERTLPRARAPLDRVVRRLVAAMSRRRYFLAFNALASFGLVPLGHHDAREGDGQELEGLLLFLETLAVPEQANAGSGVDGGVRGLGLLDSIVAIAVDSRQEGVPSDRRPRLEDLPRRLRLPSSSSPVPSIQVDRAALAKATGRMPALALISAMRRRRSVAGLRMLLPKYLRLSEQGEPRLDDLGELTPAERRQKEVDLFLTDLVAAKALVRVEGGDYWMGRNVRNALYEGVRKKAGDSSPENGVAAVKAATLLISVHQDLATYYHRGVYVGSQDVLVLLEECFHRMAALHSLCELEHLLESVVIPDGSDLQPWLDELSQDAGAHPRSEAQVSAARLESDGDEQEEKFQDHVWRGAVRLASPGHLEMGALLQSRHRSLRALRELVMQETDALLAGVAGQTLSAWLSDLRQRVEEVARGPGLGDEGEWAKGLQQELNGLLDLCDDLQCDMLADRRSIRQLCEVRAEGLERLVRDSPASTMERAGADVPEITLSHGFPKLAELWRISRLERDDRDQERVRRRVCKSLLATASALGRSSKENVDDGAQFAKAAAWLLYDWLTQAEKDPERLERSRRLGGPAKKYLLELRLEVLRVFCDLELWGVTPWEGRSFGMLADLHRRAGKVDGLTADALRILDAIHEPEPAYRSHFHSLRGRASYLRSDFDGAHREFDRARAGLLGGTLAEREALAICLLREAECLLLHADHQLNTWAVDAAERQNQGRDPEVREAFWEGLLSSEGWRKWWAERGNGTEAAGEEGQKLGATVRQLCQQSMGNMDADRVEEIERGAAAPDADPLELRHVFEAMRARINAAGDRLDRAEALLERCRRRVEWWSCLFQLRAQLAVEQQLLLLSGDFEPLLRDLPDGVATAAQATRREQATNVRDAHWTMSFAAVTADPTATGRSILRRFISRFQRQLRDGLTAVRRGLDIVLPLDLQDVGDDVLAERLLRLWVGLMVGGAYSTAVSGRGGRPPDDPGSRGEKQGERNLGLWTEWEYLNGLSGFHYLPQSKAIRKWFLGQEWWRESPSLATRSLVLARVDLCLAQDKEVIRGSTKRPPVKLHNGNATKVLIEHLRKRR
jgi:hypothetical protein